MAVEIELLEQAIPADAISPRYGGFWRRTAAALIDLATLMELRVAVGKIFKGGPHVRFRMSRQRAWLAA